MAIEYRAYAIGPDGRIVQRVDLICDDEDVAKERARQLADEHEIELWCGDRLIARFEIRH